MDKFGIFKLLNSFLGSENQTFNVSETAKSSTSADFLNALSTILQPTNDKSPSIETPKSTTPQTKTNPPLQSAMLSTMQSHDAFVNRVKNKNPNT